MHNVFIKRSRCTKWYTRMDGWMDKQKGRQKETNGLHRPPNKRQILRYLQFGSMHQRKVRCSCLIILLRVLFNIVCRLQDKLFKKYAFCGIWHCHSVQRVQCFCTCKVFVAFNVFAFSLHQTHTTIKVSPRPLRVCQFETLRHFLLFVFLGEVIE